MKELNDFLDEQYDVEDEGFKITDPDTADWALTKIKDYRQQMADNSELAESKKERIDTWEKQVNSTLQNSIDFFQSHLAIYASEKRDKDPKFKSEKLPNGFVRFKKQKPKVEMEKDTVMTWLRNHGYEDLIQTEEKVNISDIKKKLSPTAKNHGLYTPDGERIMGVYVEEQPDKFEIEVK